MAEKIGLEAVLDISDFRKGLKFYLSGVDKMNKQTVKTSQSVSGSFNSLGSSVLSLSGIIAGVGVAAVTALAGAFTALGVAAVKEGAAYTKEMSNVKAITGAVDEEFAKLEAQAEKLGATTKFTATEAAEGMSFLAMAGFEVNDILGAMPGVLDLAAAGNLELGKASDIVSNILSGFGAEVEETGKFVDILTKTFTSSNTSLEQLGQAMKFVAPVAAGLGQSVEDVSAAMGTMGDAGIQASMAGTTMRKILLGLTAPTSRAKDLMTELGVQVFDASGKMLPFPEIVGNMNEAMEGMSDAQKAATLNTLVGKTAISGFTVLLEKGEAELQKFGDELRDSVGTAATIAATQLDNLSGDVTLLQSTFSGLKIDIFKALEPLLRDLVQLGTDLLSSFGPNLVNVFTIISDAVSQFSTTVNNLIETFQRGGAAGLAESLGITPQFFELVTKIIENFTQLSDTISGILSPALDNLASGGALQAINTAIEFVNENFEAFKGAIIGVGVALAGAAIAALVAGIATAIAALATPVTAIIAIAALLGAAWADNWFGIRDITQSTIQALMPFFEQVKTIFNEFIGALLPVLQDAWKQLQITWEQLQEPLAALGTALVQLAEALGFTTGEGTLLDAVLTALKVVMLIVLSMVQSLIPAIELIGDVIGFFAGQVAEGVDKLTQLVEAFRQLVDPTVAMEERLKAIGSALADLAVPDLFVPGSPTPFEEGLMGITKALGTPLQNAFRKFQTAAQSGFLVVVDQLISISTIFKDLIENLLPTIADTTDEVTVKMIGAFKSVDKAVSNANNTVAGIIVDMSTGFSSINSIVNVLNTTFTNTITAFNNMAISLSNFSVIISGLSTTINGAIGVIVGPGSISEAVSSLTSKLDSLETAAEKAESAVKFGSSVKDKIDSVKSSVNKLKEALNDVKKAAEQAAEAIRQIPTVGGGGSSSQTAFPTASSQSLLTTGNTSTSTISNITNQFFTISIGANMAEQTTAAQLAQAIRIEVGQALSGA